MMKAIIAAALLGSAAAATAAPNLVTNGNFSQGNTGFDSTYTYVDPSVPNGGYPEKSYTVTTKAAPEYHNLWLPVGDHTGDGKALIFVANGSPDTSDIVWKTEADIAVTEGTKYFFEAFANNICCSVPASQIPRNPARLSFLVNDEVIGTLTVDDEGVWQALSTTWTAGAGVTSAMLSIRNAQSAFNGNDFALDDIYFGTETSVVPEPAALGLLGLGVLGLAAARRRKAA